MTTAPAGRSACSSLTLLCIGGCDKEKVGTKPEDLLSQRDPDSVRNALGLFCVGKCTGGGGFSSHTAAPDPGLAGRPPINPQQQQNNK